MWLLSPLMRAGTWSKNFSLSLHVPVKGHMMRHKQFETCISGVFKFVSKDFFVKVSRSSLYLYVLTTQLVNSNFFKGKI